MITSPLLLLLTEWREGVARNEDREPRRARNLSLTQGTSLKITYSSFSHSISVCICLFVYQVHYNNDGTAAI